MVISYYGKGYVKATLGELTVALNPTGKDAPVKGPRFGADVTLVSSRHHDYSGVELTAFGDREPFVIDGPGEYEAFDLFIRGIASPGKDAQNTMYTIIADGVTLCHLGALASPELPADTVALLTGADVLFVPTYGEETLTVAGAQKLSTALEPKLIVPLFYGGEKHDTLKQFLKEAGAEGTKPVDKFTFKRKDLEGKEGDVVVVQSF